METQELLDLLARKNTLLNELDIIEKKLDLADNTEEGVFKALNETQEYFNKPARKKEIKEKLIEYFKSNPKTVLVSSITGLSDFIFSDICRYYCNLELELHKTKILDEYFEKKIIENLNKQEIKVTKEAIKEVYDNFYLDIDINKISLTKEEDDFIIISFDKLSDLEKLYKMGLKRENIWIDKNLRKDVNTMRKFVDILEGTK